MAAAHVAVDLDDLVVVDACDAPPAIVVYHCGGNAAVAVVAGRRRQHSTANRTIERHQKVRPGIPHYPILE